MWRFSDFGSDAACIDEHGQGCSYAELIEAVEYLSGYIPPRALIFSFCENTPGSLIGYVSFLTNRAVPLMLDAHLEQALTARLIEAYRPAYLWLPEHREMPECAGRTGSERGCRGTSGYRVVLRRWGYRLLETGLEPYRLHEDLALLVTTSGSTGSPKLVRQSYRNIQSNTESIVSYLGIDRSERPITTLPMNYVYGTSIVNTHLSRGATLLLTTKTLVQREFWRFFREHGATSIAGVPYTYEMLEKLRFTRMDLTTLRTMTQAGGKLHPDLHRKFAEYAQSRGARFVVMYGAAEATARMGYLPPEQALAKSGCMGYAIPGGRFELIGEDGELIARSGEVGELVYYGDNVTLGYAERGEDLALGDERHGRYRTGDLASRDDDGCYTVVGRKKRFLKLYGNRVGLDEAERMLRGEFPEIECACGGVDDQMRIYLTDAGHAAPAVRFLAAKTGIHPNAFCPVVVPAIPRNEAGKILYRELSRFDDR